MVSQRQLALTVDKPVIGPTLGHDKLVPKVFDCVRYTSYLRSINLCANEGFYQHSGHENQRPAGFPQRWQGKAEAG